MDNSNILYRIFSKPIIGRPIRKIISLTIKFTGYTHWVLTKILERHPYVVNLDKKLKLNKKLNKEQIRPIISYYKHLRYICSELPYQPKISIIIPVYKVNLVFFKELLHSIELQSYQNWEACIVDDKSDNPKITALIDNFAKKHPGKVKHSTNEINSHISITSNNAIKLATGEYIALLDHDDVLMPNALGEMVRFINLNDKPDILYSDERVIDETGKKVATYFKPSWSPFMHLSMNYTTHLSVYKTRLVRDIGGFRKGYEGSQDHDLMLRMVEASKKPIVHIPLCLYQWRAHDESTAKNVDSKPYAATAGEKAVSEACERRGRPAKVTYEPQTVHYRVKYLLPKETPKISIIIPTRNSYKYIKRCLASILINSTYSNFEIIIVDNGSNDESCHNLYKKLQSDYPNKLNVIHYNIPFNFARLINKGVEHASGEYLILLNNDTEVITKDWMEELLRHAQFPEVGAVGCKLLYDDDTIQHAGIILSGKEIAHHVGLFLKKSNKLYCDSLNTVHETSGVTGACLMISKEKFLSVEGLEEINIPNAFGDVDLCLKLRQQGYSNIYTPYAQLTHFESKSRGSNYEEFERQYMTKKWGHILISDPYLNPNFMYGQYYQINVESTKADVEWFPFDYD